MKYTADSQIIYLTSRHVEYTKIPSSFSTLTNMRPLVQNLDGKRDNKSHVSSQIVSSQFGNFHGQQNNHFITDLDLRG